MIVVDGTVRIDFFRGATTRQTTVLRSLVDVGVIGTFCIERHHVLLHNDCDLEPMETHLGLQVLRPRPALAGSAAVPGAAPLAAMASGRRPKQKHQIEASS